MQRHLTVERNKHLLVKLYPEVSNLTREQPPIASFVIKLVSTSSPNRKTIVHPGCFFFVNYFGQASFKSVPLVCIMIVYFYSCAVIFDKQLKSNDDFVWAVENFFSGRFIVDVEFLDLKIASPSVRHSNLSSCCILHIWVIFIWMTADTDFSLILELLNEPILSQKHMMVACI